VRELRWEKWIEKYGVEYVYVPALPLNQLNQKACLENRARSFETDPATVEQYHRRFLAGETPPPILVWQDEDGRYITFDGNHRWVAALLAGIETLEAYVILTRDPDIILPITVNANRRLGGLGGDIKDQYQNAARAVRNGMSVVDAARVYDNLHPDRLREYTNAEASREELAKLGYTKLDPKRFNQSMLTTLYSVRMTPVKQALMELILTRKHLVADRIAKEITPRLNKIRSESEQLEFLRQLGERPSVKKEPKFRELGKPRSSDNLLFEMRKLILFLEKAEYPADLHITDPDLVEEARGVAHTLAEHLTRIF
jgi:hypothetical protein